jgi:HEAT repeat protein
VSDTVAWDDGYDGALRLALGEPVERVVGGPDAGPEAWLALDAGVRQALCDSSWEPGHERWRALRNLWLGGDGPYTPSSLALALCHRDGRVRERALKEAEAVPEVLPLVVVRCADWAGPVRLRARRLLARKLTVERAVALAPLVLRVGRRSRGEYAAGLVRDVLRHASAGQLRPLLDHPDRRARRFGVELAVRGELFTAAELARKAAADADIVVQDRCADAALAALPEEGPARDAVLEPLLTARNTRARSSGVTALRRAGRPQAAEAYLTDRSSMVRACARWVLREHGVDALPRYRALCADPADPALPPGAVPGLVECGGREDAALLRPLLAHPAAAVRAEAVAGLRKLDAVTWRELVPLLDDPSSAVVREAATALLPDAHRLDAAALTRMLEPGDHRRRAAFRLLTAQGGRPALRAVVKLLDDPDALLRVQAAQRLGDWRPTPDIPKGDPETAALLEGVRDRVPRSRQALLAWATGVDLTRR